MTINYYKGWTGWADPSIKVQNIAIHKNGTSYIEHHAKQMGWEEIPVSDDPSITRFAILRDPWERYLTAYVEDIYDVVYYKPELKERVLDFFKNDNLIIDVLIEMNVFKIGVHTQLHCQWINPLSKDATVFFKMNPNLGFDLHHWLNSVGVLNSLNNSKIYERNKKECIIYNQLLNFFNNNKKSKDKVLQYLEPDYELLNNIKFYNE